VDDPLLTARPADHTDIKRIATRVVVDSNAALLIESRLVRTARDIPVMVAAAASADPTVCERLAASGVEVYRCAGNTHVARFDALLEELGRRSMTNVLVEGGSKLLGTLFDVRAIDEVRVFIAPKLAGGATAPSPIGGAGVDRMTDALRLADITIEELEGDVYIHGRLGA
jgi:diaminohydroxyphosphoribosylaminopyrimidine deaminase/5-amino-6-(5-phosphoribosylamino)uracil reductase